MEGKSTLWDTKVVKFTLNLLSTLAELCSDAHTSWIQVTTFLMIPFPWIMLIAMVHVHSKLVHPLQLPFHKESTLLKATDHCWGTHST